jgi:hypothetical protein
MMMGGSYEASVEKWRRGGVLSGRIYVRNDDLNECRGGNVFGYSAGSSACREEDGLLTRGGLNTLVWGTTASACSTSWGS